MRPYNVIPTVTPCPQRFPLSDLHAHIWLFLSLGSSLLNCEKGDGAHNNEIKTVEGIMEGWPQCERLWHYPHSLVCVCVCVFSSLPPAHTLEGSAANISMQDFLMIWRQIRRKGSFVSAHITDTQFTAEVLPQ